MRNELRHFEFFGIIHFYVIMKIKSPFVLALTTIISYDKEIVWSSSANIFDGSTLNALPQPMSGVERSLAF